MDAIRNNVYKSLEFSRTNEVLQKEVILDLITITNDPNNKSVARINAVKKILDITNDDMDPILIKVLLCFKGLVEIHPYHPPQKKVMENELCKRFQHSIFQSLFQSLFDSEEGNDFNFKWTNTINKKRS